MRCDRDHRAMKEDVAVWLSLPFVGIQNFGNGEYGVLRNCACGSTLCRLVSRVEAAATLLTTPTISEAA